MTKLKNKKQSNNVNVLLTAETENDSTIFYRARFLLEFLYVDNIIKSNIKIEDVFKKYDNGDVLVMQEFIGEFIKNEHTWMTSIGLIDAMDLIYNDAVSNGNIK